MLEDHRTTRRITSARERRVERLGHLSPSTSRTGDAREEIRSPTCASPETHPDRYAAASQAARDLAEQAFREVTRTYDLLTDPVRLANYREDPNRDRKEAQALEEAQRAIGAEREFQKGEARLRSHDWSGALTHFERAVELYPDEGEYIAYCGYAYYLTHGHADDVFKTAFAMVKKGAKLAPDREKPYLFLGRLCQAAGGSSWPNAYHEGGGMPARSIEACASCDCSRCAARSGLLDAHAAAARKPSDAGRVGLIRRRFEDAARRASRPRAGPRSAPISPRRMAKSAARPASKRRSVQSSSAASSASGSGAFATPGTRPR
jgi:tetratricopeptide (TPR) repeat protein